MRHGRDNSKRCHICSVLVEVNSSTVTNRGFDMAEDDDEEEEEDKDIEHEDGEESKRASKVPVARDRTHAKSARPCSPTDSC